MQLDVDKTQRLWCPEVRQGDVHMYIPMYMCLIMYNTNNLSENMEQDVMSQDRVHALFFA